jgi:phospholipid-binding lipoprotein MlaA
MLRFAIFVLAAATCTGCAATHRLAADAPEESGDAYASIAEAADSPQHSPVSDKDRFPRINRSVYRFNRTLDRNLLRPVARGYSRVVPQKVERRVRNFFRNLRAPIDIVNNLLQGKFADGFSDVGRFLLNSTAGLGGLFDPAGRIGLERHQEDFGQTLAVWGVPSGSYLMLPLLGPGTVRDWGAFAMDLRADTLIRVRDSDTRWALVAWRFISDRAALLPAERALESSFDEYNLVRDAYRQHRLYDIRDGQTADDDYLYLDSEP